MINYSPKPGTIPAMLIEHLTKHGGTMTRAAVANGFSIQSKNVDGNMATVIKHGLIVRHQGEGMKTCYGLPGSDPSVEAPTPPSSMTIQRGAMETMVLSPKKAQAAKQRKATRAVQDIALTDSRAVVQPAADAPPPPIASLWEDGDIVLYGIQINSDDTVTLTGHQARRVHKFMERCFGPNE